MHYSRTLDKSHLAKDGSGIFLLLILAWEKEVAGLTNTIVMQWGPVKILHIPNDASVIWLLSCRIH